MRGVRGVGVALCVCGLQLFHVLIYVFIYGLHVNTNDVVGFAIRVWVRSSWDYSN